ncbi:HopJ type III effector protein [Rheinheimera baltica]|uniref:HopJ type III effector protein n=1 Tax=Rheinheimera baltica TaxID=67576 RepID=UPI00273EBB73|nr:HopJ type III effector protein [Rheinheimera baltica]MDP5150210.1 HopJ type III effector protein [Rheinheimera baltica]
MLEHFFIQLSTEPETISFEQSISLIDALYDFTPTAFKNGELYSSAGENNGSCKILAFGLLHQLSAPQTLFLFGDYYRVVLDSPKNNDHQNIRNFIRSGWDGVEFEQIALSAKSI